jgi:predicted nucleic acid-binding protein
LRSLPTDIEKLPPNRVFDRITELATVEMLSVYDACYLEMATRLAIPLACWDGGVRAAAGRRGVRLES